MSGTGKRFTKTSSSSSSSFRTNKKSKGDDRSSVPLSLGKPSLRRRLEAYYRQVAPEQIENPHEWKDRFHKIWDKFGGSIPGEQKLATKLERKYGSIVRLHLAVDQQQQEKQLEERSTELSSNNSNNNLHIEKYYELSISQRDSGVVSFTSPDFDPVAALAHNDDDDDAVLRVNPWLADCPIFDRVELCRSILPRTDPLFRAAKRGPPFSATQAANTAAGKAANTKAPPAFVAIASMYQQGPFSLLYETLMRRKRVRVVIRYSNGIRGTLTGTLLAFDKHFNLLLRNVDEVYSPPNFVNNNNNISSDETEEECHKNQQQQQQSQSNTEIEVERRLRVYAGGHGSHVGEAWSCRQRHLPQILVRGDTVVSIYKPEMEQSCWPVTKKSPTDTLYRKQSARKHVSPQERIGTPGSLSLVVASRKRPAKT